MEGVGCEVAATPGVHRRRGPCDDPTSGCSHPVTGPQRVRILVVMGVSGVGKSTIATSLSTLLGWTFAEGDAFHPQANVATMAAGTPLSDEDRWPWLQALGGWMSEEIAAGRPAVVTCSALRRPYRDLLREGRPEVLFCHLVAGEDLIRERMTRRSGHYMPVSLLHSQFGTLEPLDRDEPGFVVSVDGSAAQVIDRVLAELGIDVPEGDPRDSAAPPPGR